MQWKTNICISIAANLMQFSVVSFQRNSRCVWGEFSSLFSYGTGLLYSYLQSKGQIQQSRWGRCRAYPPGPENLTVLWMREEKLTFAGGENDLSWEFKGRCCSLLARLASLEAELRPSGSLGNGRNEVNECNNCLLQTVCSEPWDLQLYDPCNCLGSWRKCTIIEYPCPHLHQNEFGINFERNPVFKSYTFCTFLNISHW